MYYFSVLIYVYILTLIIFKPVDSLILGYVRHSFGKEQCHEFVITELYLSIQFYL